MTTDEPLTFDRLAEGMVAAYGDHWREKLSNFTGDPVENIERIERGEITPPDGAMDMLASLLVLDTDLDHHQRCEIRAAVHQAGARVGAAIPDATARRVLCLLLADMASMLMQVPADPPDAPPLTLAALLRRLPDIFPIAEA